MTIERAKQTLWKLLDDDVIQVRPSDRERFMDEWGFAMSLLDTGPAVNTPRIVCAANRFENGPMLVGARHFDQHMCVQAEYMGIRGSEPHEQGFIDQLGKFYSRKAAWVVAQSQGQIIRRCGGDEDGTLWSENLY